jgi:hypothetical protein
MNAAGSSVALQGNWRSLRKFPAFYLMNKTRPVAVSESFEVLIFITEQ